MLEYIGPLLRGALVTIQLTVVSGVLGLVVAFAVGMAQRASRRLIRIAANAYVELFRGTSLLVQMFWFFYVLPLLGVSMDPYVVGVLTLSLNTGAYGADVVRGAIQSVGSGQWDAAVALNLSPSQRYRLVIIPQAVTLMLAPFGNLMIVLLKGTSLVSLITVTDLTFAAQSLRAAEGRTALVLFLVLVIYFALSMLISWAVHALEARFKARYSLELPAPPSLVSAGGTP